MTDAASLDALLKAVVREAVREAMAGFGAGGMALTVKQAAAELHMGTTKIRELMDAGEIPVVRSGGIVRIRRTALEEWMRANEGGQPWHSAPAPIVDDMFRDEGPTGKAPSGGASRGNGSSRRSR